MRVIGVPRDGRLRRFPGVLETIGFDAAVAASFAPWRAADASVGRVVRVDRGVVIVLTEAGAERATLGGALLSELAEDPAGTPCAGDWVVVRSWPDGPHTLERVLPRRSLVPGAGAAGHVTTEGCPVRAANVDVVVLLPDAEPSARQPVQQGGVVVVTVDPSAPDALDLVRERLGERRTVALLGAAGTIGGVLDRLVGTNRIGGRKHGAELVLVPGGGAVLGLATTAHAPAAGGRHAARPFS